jgi:decaprenylphospho-beta-D-ribofuranose 2-oxidase
VKTAVKRFLLNTSRRGGALGKGAFWWLYKHAIPRLEEGLGVRNDALTPPYKPLSPMKDGHAQTLNVVVVPREGFAAFMDEVRELPQHHDVNVFMGTVYPVRADSTAALRAVKRDSYVVTLLVDAVRTDSAQRGVNEFYRSLAEASLRQGGTMYLTHQLPFTRSQVQRAYPELEQILEVRKRYDPTGLFDNVLVDKYG